MLVDDVKPASLPSSMLLVISKLVVSTYKLFEYFHAYVFIKKNSLEEINIDTNQFHVNRTIFLLYLPRERLKHIYSNLRSTSFNLQASSLP